MNKLALDTDGPYCSISSHLQDMRIPWVPSDEVNIEATFAREIAKLRVLDDYTATDRDHHMAFIGGFRG